MTTLYATVECIQRLEPFQTVVPLSISHHSLIRQLSQIVTSEFNVAPFSIVLLSQIEALYPIQHHSLIVL